LTDVLVAIDMVGGEVVRLTKGEMGQKTVYGRDPVQTALEWQAAGAPWLHLVDLDGATGSGFDNTPFIRGIVQAVDIPVQVGGGIRSLQAVERWLVAGVSRVCIGTKALDPVFLRRAVEEFADRLVASLDTRGGKIHVSGWTEVSPTATLDAAVQLVERGVSRIMFTDIERDGTLAGPNVTAIQEVLDAVDVPVIAAGGISQIGDVEQLAALAPKGLEGIVIGRALYAGTIELAEALAVAGC
jgi:phosphoribosylformimino-5-aminoimidazole carboxamide ribotide isomerase